MEGTLFLRLRRVFALRGNRREALRDVVLGGPNDGDATRILCDRRIGNRERQCERERDDGRGFEHSPSPSPRRWLAAWERTVWRDGWPVIKRLPDCPAARWDASSRDGGGRRARNPSRRRVSLSLQL